MDYDVIVVGAGVEGSSTAYHLASHSKRTLLLEQVSLVPRPNWEYIIISALWLLVRQEAFDLGVPTRNKLIPSPNPNP